MKKRLWSVCLIAILSVAAVYANYNVYRSMGGNNDPGAGNIGLWARSQVDADPVWYNYESGPTFIKVWVTGLSNPYCAEGSNAGSACQDSAHAVGWGGWWSAAQPTYNIVPYGCYQAVTDVWVNGEYKSPQSSIVQCFPDPPNLAGNGYCVSFDWDSSRGDWVCNESPIVIATGKSRDYTLSRDRVYFDIDADGTPDPIYWTKEGSDVAFLAIDRDGDGQITSGAELFGGRTVAGAHNGFAALRVMAGQSVGELNAGNPLFAKLLLWTDRNHDGQSQPDELQPASNVLDAIGLGYRDFKRKDGLGNTFSYEGWARKAGTGNPRSRELNIYDVIFALAK